MTTDMTNETQPIFQPGFRKKPAKFSWKKGQAGGAKTALKTGRNLGNPVVVAKC